MPIISKGIFAIKDFLQYEYLKIPDYQRPYKWTSQNVRQLLEDVERFKGPNKYRIGTIVLHKENGEHYLVDGQQRTISFLLILKAILSCKKEEISNEKLLSLLDKLSDTPRSFTFKNAISIQNIYNNYREIEWFIANVSEDYIQYFLNECEVTLFVLDDISEAFQFFDSQNSRGKDLEPHDLLKAFHLRELANGEPRMTESEKERLVDVWEETDSTVLSALFSDFLYRVRGWAKGNSSRYFSKRDTPLFKGISPNKLGKLRHTQVYDLAQQHLLELPLDQQDDFPFQLDHLIINGKHFFKMITYYQKSFKELPDILVHSTGLGKEIWDVLQKYSGRNRTGDKYVRMLFNCAIMHYLDKFGQDKLDLAIQKIFIWAYTPRLEYQNLQIASIDNYVVRELNIFKIMKEAIYCEDIIALQLPLAKEWASNDKVAEISGLFKKMKYHANLN